MDDLSELYLYVDYKGDRGWAYIGGELIHDDFSNGTTWKIALKEHAEKLKDSELYIYISPMPDPGSVRIEYHYICESHIIRYSNFRRYQRVAG